MAETMRKKETCSEPATSTKSRSLFFFCARSDCAVLGDITFFKSATSDLSFAGTLPLVKTKARGGKSVADPVESVSFCVRRLTRRPALRRRPIGRSGRTEGHVTVQSSVSWTFTRTRGACARAIGA